MENKRMRVLIDERPKDVSGVLLFVRGVLRPQGDFIIFCFRRAF